MPERYCWSGNELELPIAEFDALNRQRTELGLPLLEYQVMHANRRLGLFHYPQLKKRFKRDVFRLCHGYSQQDTPLGLAARHVLEKPYTSTMWRKNLAPVLAAVWIISRGSYTSSWRVQGAAMRIQRVLMHEEKESA